MGPLKRNVSGKPKGSTGRGSGTGKQSRLTDMCVPRQLGHNSQHTPSSTGDMHHPPGVYRPSITFEDLVPVPMDEDRNISVEQFTLDELLNLNHETFVEDSQQNGQGDGGAHPSSSRGETPFSDPVSRPPVNDDGEDDNDDEDEDERPPSELSRGGTSTGGGLDEETPLGSMPHDEVRPWIVPAGDDNFDPPSAVKRIGTECIAPGFKVGWTTLETCDADAPMKWFEHFKSYYRWDSIHTDQINSNFRKKAAKILQDAWAPMRRGKTKGPKWLSNAHKVAAKVYFNTDTGFLARSARNKRNQEIQHSRNGPLMHGYGSRPAHFHKAKMEKTYNRQVLPTDMFDKKFKRKDGTFFTAGAEQKREELAEAEAVVLNNHKDKGRVPEEELVDVSATVMGVNPRSGIPYLYGPAATLVSDKFSATGTQSTASSQRSTTAPADALLSKVEEFGSRLDLSQTRQETEMRNMKEGIERLMHMQAEMMRMFATGNPFSSSQRRDEGNSDQ